jgi:Na+/melibiose symporter-like transporter
MYAAAAPSAVLFALLWYPPADWSDSWKLGYMATVVILLRAVTSVYEIPNIAQAPELTADFHERTSLLSYRYFFFFLAGTGLTFATYRLFLRPTAEYPVGQLNPQGYREYAIAAAGLMFLAMVVSSLGTRGRITNPPQLLERHAGLGALFRAMVQTFSNRPFLLVTGAGITKSMALGISGSLGIYISTYYWGLSAKQMSILVIDGTIAAFLASFVTRPVSARLGKKNTALLFYSMSFVIAVIPVTLRYFGLFVPNGSPALVPILFAVGLVFGTFGIGATIMTSSMIADVVEDSQLQTGRRAEGLIFSATSLVSKSVSGLGIMGAGLLLSAIQFPKGTPPSGVSPETIASLAIYVPVSGLLYAIGTLLLSFYSIDEKRHLATLNALREREVAGDGEVRRSGAVTAPQAPQEL